MDGLARQLPSRITVTEEDYETDSLKAKVPAAMDEPHHKPSYYEPQPPMVEVAVGLRREIAEFQRLGSNGKQVLREALTEACMAALYPDGDSGCLDEHPAVQYLARHGFVRQLRCPLQPVPVVLRPRGLFRLARGFRRPR